MAGMLPGVECARRRRFGNSTESFSGSRRSFFCLYPTSYEMHRGRTSMRSVLSKESSREALGTVASEARERLDAKLMTQRQSGSGLSVKAREQEEQSVVKNLIDSGVQREVFCGTKKKKKKGRRRWFKWSKLGWEAAAEPADCAVCLEDFKAGDVLVHLLCDHRFHCDCVMPWLETSSQCPCCRTSVFSI